MDQKGCHKCCLGTNDKLAIAKCILRNCKRTKTNLNIAIDYKKLMCSKQYYCEINLFREYKAQGVFQGD